MSSNIHLRGVDHQLMTSIKHAAADQEVSMNSLIITILQRSFGLAGGKKKTICHDFDKFAGTWNKQQTQQFLKELKQFEKIDKDLWE